jgi:hypothetical protein
VSSDEVVKEIAARLKKRKDLDPDVVTSVTEALLTTGDPVAAVDALDSQLYKVAMRRAEKK